MLISRHALASSSYIPIPRGVVATTPEEAATAYTTLQRQCRTAGAPFVCNVKAQLHAPMSLISSKRAVSAGVSTYVPT